MFAHSRTVGGPRGMRGKEIERVTIPADVAHVAWQKPLVPIGRVEPAARVARGQRRGIVADAIHQRLFNDVFSGAARRPTHGTVGERPLVTRYAFDIGGECVAKPRPSVSTRIVAKSNGFAGECLPASEELQRMHAAVGELFDDTVYEAITRAIRLIDIDDAGRALHRRMALRLALCVVQVGERF